MALDRLSQVTSSGISTTISFRSAGINVSGIVTATTFVGALTGNASSATIATYTSEWILGANGSLDYTFTGPGFTGAENDPVLYLVRGQQYKFTNTMGAHPFRIQSTVNGSTGTQYNDGITNNDVSNGTLTWDVQFDAPNLLYYQCTSHGNMGGKIYILNSEDNVSAGTTSAPSISPSGDSNTGIFFPSADTIAFAEGGAEAMRIDSSSRLLVGTSSSSNVTRAEFYGQSTSSTEQAIVRFGRGSNPSGAGDHLTTLQFAALTSGGVYATIEAMCDGTPGASDYPGRIVLATTADGASGPTERFKIANQGRHSMFSEDYVLALRSASAASGIIEAIYVARSATSLESGTGVFAVYTNGTYATLSDQTEKKNIETTRDGYLDDLNKLRVVKYNWNEQEDNEPKELGLIAQEVEQVFPGLINEMRSEEGELPKKGVKAGVLPYMLIKALQEATARIEALEVEVAALKAQ